MHWALNRGSSAKHSTEYPRVLKLWMVFAKRWTSSYGDPPKSNMLCTGVQTLQKIKPNHSDQRSMEKVHNRKPTATHKDRTFRKSPKTVQVQDNFNQVPRTYNKHVMLWSSAAGVFHMALPSFSWPLGSYIIGSYKYLSTEQRTTTNDREVAKTVQWVHKCPTSYNWHQNR